MTESPRIRPESLDFPLITADGLCRIEIWSEEQWTALPVERRPVQFVHAPGLGWVGAVPIRQLDGHLALPSAPDRRRAERRRADLGYGVERRRRERRGPHRRRADRAIATGSAREVAARR